MIRFFLITWILGLFTLVPYGTYYLFFEATRDEYAFVGVSVLFWIFGYWGVAGPLISAWKVHSLMKKFERIQTQAEFEALVKSEESREAAIDLIAAENKVPKFIARKMLNKLVKMMDRAGDQ